MELWRCAQCGSTTPLTELQTTAHSFLRLGLLCSRSPFQKRRRHGFARTVRVFTANDGVWQLDKDLAAVGLALLHAARGLTKGVCGTVRRESLQLLTPGFGN